jgi:hypothetical protein
MGCYDIFCILCGCPAHGGIYAEENDEIKFAKYNKIINWLDNCTLLLANGSVVHNCTELNVLI